MRTAGTVAMALLAALVAGYASSAAAEPASGVDRGSEARPAAAPAVSSDCPLTRPDVPFLAPSPQPERPPDRYQAQWFGTGALWTMLSPEGEVWRGLPRSRRGFGQKTFWWSEKWPGTAEPEPAITVVGTRLDGPGTFRAGDPGTNAFADFGAAMLVGVDVPTAGCWRLTGHYRGAELSYVVWVGND